MAELPVRTGAELHWLLKQAIGSKNQKNIAAALGITAAYLSRKLNKLDETRIDEIDKSFIIKLADLIDPRYGITKLEIYQAAGIPCDNEVAKLFRSIKYVIEDYLVDHYYVKDISSDDSQWNFNSRHHFTFDLAGKDTKDTYCRIGQYAFFYIVKEHSEIDGLLECHIGQVYEIISLIRQSAEKHPDEKLPDRIYFVFDDAENYGELESLNPNTFSVDKLWKMLVDKASGEVKADEPFFKRQ